MTIVTSTYRSKRRPFRAMLIATTMLVVVTRITTLDEHPPVLPFGWWSDIHGELHETHTAAAEASTPTAGTSASSGGRVHYASARIDGSGAVRAETDVVLASVN